MSFVQALVLAAGKGKRMGSDIPKVMLKAGDKPLIEWVLLNLTAAGVSTITLVVGWGKEEVIGCLPAGVDWVEQTELLGTGHAVMAAQEKLSGFSGSLLVTCGDMPLLKSGTFTKILQKHDWSGAAATLLTALAEPPHSYGRVMRQENGAVLRIVEAADACTEELAVNEINTGVYVFAKEKLFAALAKVKSNNKQGEYYLTDVIGIMIADNEKVEALRCEDVDEAIGVNSPEDLAKVNSVLALGAT